MIGGISDGEEEEGSDGEGGAPSRPTDVDSRLTAQQGGEGQWSGE